jgi:probable rRNA maturation factor
MRIAEEDLKIKNMSKILTDFVKEQEGINFSLNIIITDNEGIRKYNKTYRDIDRATDVLSFPMLENNDGELIYEPYEIEDGCLLLGDLIISYEKCLEQAASYEHSFDRETAFLLSHGMLHLLGYDHDTKEREALMRDVQEKILQKKELLR